MFSVKVKHGLTYLHTPHQVYGSKSRDRTYEYAINSRGHYHSGHLGILEVRARIELASTGLQSVAYPLCYRTKIWCLPVVSNHPRMLFRQTLIHLS